MKRILAFLLAMTILAGMGITALAAAPDIDDTDQDGTGSFEKITEGTSKSISVYGKYDDSKVTPTTYKVTVSWEEMTFQCSLVGDYKWQSWSHTYDDRRTTQWDKGKVTIKVANHSSANVNVTATYSQKSDAQGAGNVQFRFSNGSNKEELTLTGGMDKVFDERSFILSHVSGEPDWNNLPEDGKIELGSVTIAVTAADTGTGS